MPDGAEPMEPARLFVYGSLMPGRSNHDVVRGIGGRWEEATVRGRLADEGWGAALGYPALILDEQGREVPGHLLTSSELSDHWERLDTFEGRAYRRVETTVRREDGTPARAFVYVLRTDVAGGR